MFRPAGFFILFIAMLFTSPFLFTALPTEASVSSMSNVVSGLTNTASHAGFGSTPTSANDLVAGAINIILGFLGVAVLLLIVYSGFLYVSSLGELDKVKKAKKLLGYAIMGLGIVIASYALATFALSAISTLIT